MDDKILNGGKMRCHWCDESSPLYVKYHDEEWGVPCHDEGRLFEMLVLEGMQAGLSWITILKKRENFRRAFDGFDYRRVALYGEEKVEELLADSGIIRNKLKLRSVVGNARVFMEIQEEFGSFDKYIWGFSGGEPVRNSWLCHEDVPVNTELSNEISADLKGRGMSFVGFTIVYSFMQAIGMVNDHEVRCFRHGEL